MNQSNPNTEMTAPSPGTSRKLLNRENFGSGFLVDDSWMAGIVQNPDSDRYSGFIVDHTTGSYVAANEFSSLDEAIVWINSIPRHWEFEPVGGCSGGNCGNGACGAGGCAAKKLIRTEAESPRA